MRCLKLLQHVASEDSFVLNAHFLPEAQHGNRMVLALKIANELGFLCGSTNELAIEDIKKMLGDIEKSWNNAFTKLFNNDDPKEKQLLDATLQETHSFIEECQAAFARTYTILLTQAVASENTHGK